MNKRLLAVAKQALRDLKDIMPIHDPSEDKAHHAWETIALLEDVIEWQIEYSEVVVFFNTSLELIDPRSPHDLIAEDFENMFGAINEVGLEMKNGEVIRILLYMDKFGNKAVLGVEDRWNNTIGLPDNFTVGTGELKE